MKTKLTKKEICLSIITTLISFTVLMGVMMLMMLINLVNVELGLKDFIFHQYKNIITVVTAVALLMCIVYIYMFFENRSLLAQCSKIMEIYLLLCIALLLCNVVGKFVLLAYGGNDFKAQGRYFHEHSVRVYDIYIQQIFKQLRRDARPRYPARRRVRLH